MEDALGVSESNRPETGVVAFSFALRGSRLEPNPANMALARNVVDVIARSEARPFLAAQWEVDRALRELGEPADFVVQAPEDGSYLDSADVWYAAARAFQAAGVQRVVVVAKPGLHLMRVKRLVRKSEFELAPVRIHGVPYDPSDLNEQWWTRGPLRLVVYAILQALLGYRGHPRRV